jgi:hypothetical protein
MIDSFSYVHVEVFFVTALGEDKDLGKRQLFAKHLAQNHPV